MPTQNHRPVAVLCAALGLEYRAIGENVQTELVEHHERGSLYQVGDFEHWRIVATNIGRDNSPAAVQVERAIATFRPTVILLVGIAGGRRRVRHGDVVAADHVYDYQSGRDTRTESHGRVKSLAASFTLVQRAKAVAATDQWQQRIELPLDHPPAAHVGPLAAGGTVVTSAGSTSAKLIERHCDDALAIETEGFGVMAAAHANETVAAMVIRGISDLLDDKAVAADRHWQPIAARHASAFAFELLRRFHPETTSDQDRAEAAPTGTAPKYVVSQGPGATAHVGAVGDHSHGDVHVHRLTTTTTPAGQCTAGPRPDRGGLSQMWRCGTRVASKAAIVSGAACHGRTKPRRLGAAAINSHGSDHVATR